MSKIRILKEDPVQGQDIMIDQQHVEGSTAAWISLRMLPVGILKVNPKYQRMLDMAWVREIAENFNPDLVEVLQVSYRDGYYWLIDGQHTTEGINLKFNDPDYPVICKVYYGLTVEDEAEMFYLFNKNKKKMSAASMLKAKAFLGEGESRGFLQRTRDAGFIIEPEKSMNCKYAIRAVNKARNCFLALGPELYDRMLHLLRAVWDGEQWSLSRKMLGGMAALLATFGDKIDDRVFISQLKGVTEGMMEKESNRFCNEKVGIAYAAAMATLYNKGRRTGKLRQALLLCDE